MTRTEEWRPIPKYEGLYDVSNLGHVRNVITARALTGGRCSKGYWRVNLTKNGKWKTHKIAALVLLAFTGPRPPKHESAHLDGNKENNTLENLAWATSKDNSAHKKVHGTMVCGEAASHSKLTEAIVRQIRLEWERFKTNQSIMATRYGVSRHAVSQLINRGSWRHVS